ncbi:MAG: BT4734/BF3469 family protein [Bacteroidia bacterium]
MTVSFFKNKLLKANAHFSLQVQLSDIKNGRYKDVITACRLAVDSGNKQLYQSLKDQLPAVTFCGTFYDKRKADQISSYNQLLILDVDHIETNKVELIKKKIIDDPHTLACFVSPSGEGLKFLVPVSTSVEFHKNAFAALSLYYLEKYQITIDKSGSDCSRLCYLSYDPAIYINLAAGKFEFDTKTQLATTANGKAKTNFTARENSNMKITEGYNQPSDRKMIARIIKFLTKQNLSITETQEKWYKCAYAISNTFTSDIGQSYFITLSKLDGEKHNELKSYKLIEYCYLNRKTNGLQFSTIIHFAKEKGFVVKLKLDR